MAAVHFGRLEGALGFARVVAIKRLHPHVAENKELAAGFFEEAKLAARVRHSNVVQTIDVALDGDIGLLVMEYVQGEALGRLLQVACKGDEPPPANVVSAIVSGVLRGLHAAHQAKSERGEPLGIVHRDVSPQNVLVGVDGVARVLDFGIAKATARSGGTPGVRVKGKAAYLSPEQLRGLPVTPATDVFAAAIVLWESLVGRRLFLDETEAKTLSNVLTMPISAPSTFVPGLSRAMDLVVLRGLERDPTKRFATARDMAVALEEASAPASPAVVGAWVEGLAREALASRASALREVETWSGVEPSADEPPVTGLPRAHRGGRRRSRVPEIAACSILVLLGAGALAKAFGVDVTASPAPRAPKRLLESTASEEVAEPTPMAAPAVPAARTERVVRKRPHVIKPHSSAD